MNFYVLEIQNNNGTYAHLVHSAESRKEAESKYHQVLSYAAISELTTHAAILCNGEGMPLAYRCYKNEIEDGGEVSSEEI